MSRGFLERDRASRVNWKKDGDRGSFKNGNIHDNIFFRIKIERRKRKIEGMIIKFWNKMYKQLSLVGGLIGEMFRLMVKRYCRAVAIKWPYSV